MNVRHNTIFVVLVLFFTLFGYTQQTKENLTTKYILVRHSEKDLRDTSNKNPNLTEEGKKRSENLVKILKDVTIDFIYSTNYKRTLQTAAPMATHRNIEISLYTPRKLYDEAFQKKTLGKNTIIVGHSNTIPDLVNTIIGQKKYANLDETDYAKLFIITIHKGVVTDTVLNID